MLLVIILQYCLSQELYICLGLTLCASLFFTRISALGFKIFAKSCKTTANSAYNRAFVAVYALIMVAYKMKPQPNP